MAARGTQGGISDIKGGRAADTLFRIFAEMIESGVLQEGDPLPTEREIVQTYGVSRTVAREAILALSNKGLVEAKPRYRPVVRKASYETAVEIVDNVVSPLLSRPEGVRNLFEIRTMVEASLVRQAATEATKDDIAELKRALEANAAAVQNSEEFYRTDMGFHRVLYEIPGNPVLPAIHKAYTMWLAPHWSQMPRLPDRNRQNVAAHAAIYEAILMRDPDASEAALRAHLADAWEQVRKTFREK